jgi:hypothetical protein
MWGEIVAARIYYGCKSRELAQTHPSFFLDLQGLCVHGVTRCYLRSWFIPDMVNSNISRP